MSWKNFEKDAFRLTKEEWKVQQKKILANYRKAMQSIETMLKDNYAKYLTGISPDNYYNEMIKRDRLQNLLKQVRAEYVKYSSSTAFEITNALKIAFSNTYYRKYFAANWVAGKSVFGLLPKQLVELTVLGTDQAWKNITAGIIKRFGDKSLYMPRSGTLVNLLKNDSIKEINQIQEIITQRFLGGTSYTQTVNSIRDAIGREFTDGKVKRYTGAKSNALRIIRTETNRVSNLGSYAVSKDLDNQGIKIKRKLISTLDNRTRAQSASMDGQTVSVDKPFVYPNGAKAMTPGTSGVAKYDINDRETVINIVNDVEPVVRIGRDPVTGQNEYFSYNNFDVWASKKGLKKNKYGVVVSGK
jgi:hypothetical protein